MAAKKKSRRLDEAPIPGGLTKTADGRWQNANGKEVDPSSGEELYPDETDEERSTRRAEEATDNLARAEAGEDVNDDDDDGDEETVELPTLAKLERHLSKLETADEVRALQAQDDRAGAVPMYEARLAELEDQS